MKSNSSEILPVNFKFTCDSILIKLTKLKLEVLKSDLTAQKGRIRTQINLELTGKISLEFDFSSSLLL